MLESKDNADPMAEGHSVGLSLNDIYFVLFRRKWIILFFALLGTVAAGALYVRHKPVYRSDSKLLVRYVVESKSFMPLGEGAQVRSVDSGGSSVINSEIEILTSVDLFEKVVEAIGPARILKHAGGGEDKLDATAVIAKGISVDPPKSNIIKVTFRHPDPEVIKPVLERLIDEYLKRHAEIHRGLGSMDIVLSRESDQLKFQLNQTEEELRRLKSTNGVISLEETRNSYILEISNLRKELFNAEAELAEARATLAMAPTNAIVSTNADSTASVRPLDPAIPADILAQYKEVIARLSTLRNSLFGLESQFRDENPLVARAREQIAEVDRQKKALEEQHPDLVKVPVSAPTMAPSATSAMGLERTRAVALDAKIRTLKAQLETIRSDVARLDAVEPPLKQLQRQRDLAEANYRYVSSSIERERFDEALGSSRHSNITVVQNPTPPTRDASKRLKMTGAAMGGGLGFGLALAFLLELFLDRTVRRAPELEGRLNIPLFMAIPYVNGKAMRTLARNRRKRLAANGGAQREASLQAATGWESDHPLRPMFEGLRDRTVHYFRNVTHKPKLVGVSGCSDRAGATTLAAGLAAALSETGDGKVLLVDMHQPHGAAHPFFKGKRTCEIDDVLVQEKREAGMVQENLYMALATDSPERRLGLLAKRFSNLMPKLKASDYDYIIFDMPRVSAISPTLRLAGVMDLNLLVVEAQKVPREAVKEGYSLLMDTGADAQVILNKVRSYVPASLSGEL
jgi:polysaccharide biosynthesis transport protein